MEAKGNTQEGIQEESLDGSAKASPSPAGSKTTHQIDLSVLKQRLARHRRMTAYGDDAHPKCPYCKFPQQDISAKSVADDLDFYSGDDETDPEEYDCEKCERPFKLTCRFTVEWESTMTDEEFEIEEAKRPDPNQLTIFGSEARSEGVI